MSTYKHIDKICIFMLILVLLVTGLFMNGENIGIEAVNILDGYETKLFDTSRVHSIDLVMDDWDGFIEECENEEYVNCSLVIDGESYKNVGIRAKGNTSLSSVSDYGNDRYSFKVEFDHYDDALTYHGLDKLSLNNIIQDNTYMKDYLVYQMMGQFGVAAPLCSYVYITVNGEDWGLYLAVEGVEDSFLSRNYGSDCGNLYKPDSMSMGGGRGNGDDFKMEDTEETPKNDIEREGNMQPPDMGEKPESGMRPQDKGAMPEAGKDDVSLIYSDDEYDSYSNIFDSAKTEISDSDKDRLIASLKQLNEGTDIAEVVDTENVIRYFVVHNFVCNFDSYTGSMIHNYYLYEEDGKLSMIPWDYNLSFGGFMDQTDATGLVNYPIDTPVSGGTIDSRPMLAWIFEDEEYEEQYHQYFAEFLSQYFDSGYFETMIDSVEELIAPYVEKDPTKFCTYEEFEEGVSALKQFCLRRAESISGQLAGTIPSTSDGQEQEEGKLIDASDISISAMGGSMGGDRGRRKTSGEDY